MTRYDTSIDLPRLRRCWPNGRELPKLIVDISQLLSNRGWGTVGYFEMPGVRFNDYWMDGGADLWRSFGMFQQFGDGSDVAVWFHDETDARIAGNNFIVEGSEPVVMIGSEGDVQVVADSLKDYGLEWSSGNGIHGLAGDTDWDDEVAAELFLLAKSSPDPAPRDTVADLRAFTDAHAQYHRDRSEHDPVLQDIARVLDHRIPRGANSWENFSAEISAAGERVEVSGLTREEISALTPLIQTVRKLRASGSNAP